ncbi:MAG: AI-2E family transporter [Campylobacterales bacterium]
MNDRPLLLGILTITTVLLAWLFAPFAKPISVAVLLVYALWPIIRVVERGLSHLCRRWNRCQPFTPLIAASATTLILALLFFGPLAYLAISLLGSIANADLPAFWATFKGWLASPPTLPPYLSSFEEGYQAFIQTLYIWTPNPEQLQRVAVAVGSILGDAAVSLGEMVMILVFFFFFAWYAKPLSAYLQALIPLSPIYQTRLAMEVMRTLSVVFMTLLGVMIAQGVAFGLFLYFYGGGYNPLLLGLLTGFSSIVPIVGTALVWVPVALQELIRGHTGGALVIALYSYIMLAVIIDNFVKLLLLNSINRWVGGRERINEFLIFFGIVAGLATFGFWGFVLGPGIVALFVATTRLYMTKES